MSRGYRPTPRPITPEWHPTTPADHAAVERMAAANVTAVAIGRITVALKADRHADIGGLLEQLDAARLRLTNADSAYRATTNDGSGS